MRINAKRIYNITLFHAPPIIERHRENISFFFVKTRTFYWVIDILYWRLDNNEENYSRTLLSPTADSLTIAEILPKDFLCKQLLEKGINTQNSSEFVVYI